MTKIEFMKELEELLSDISLEERIEALQYYDNYFEDAGPDREQSIISELGSPKKVAASIKADLNASEQELKNRGYFTENGYEDESLREPKYEIINGTAIENDNSNPNYSDNGYSQNTSQYSSNKQNSANGQFNADSQNSDSQNNGNYNSSNNYNNENQGNGNYNYNSNNARNGKVNSNSGLKVALIIILCIFAIPVGIPLIATVFGLFIAAIATVASLWLAFVIVSVALIFTGVIVTVIGIIKLMTVPVLGICFTGGGLILFGVGLLFTVATIGLSTKVLPVLFRGFISFCRLPFRNRGVAA
ncbi:MAG: DUF1700 domain-containing protein [Anaerocolumna sp.]